MIYQTTLYLQDSGILIYDGDDTSAWLHCKEVTVLTSSWVLDSLSQYLWVNWLKWWSFVLYLILCSFSTAYYLLRSTNIDYYSHVICICNEYCFLDQKVQSSYALLRMRRVHSTMSPTHHYETSFRLICNHVCGKPLATNRLSWLERVHVMERRRTSVSLRAVMYQSITNTVCLSEAFQLPSFITINTE